MGFFFLFFYLWRLILLCVHRHHQLLPLSTHLVQVDGGAAQPTKTLMRKGESFWRETEQQRRAVDRRGRCGCRVWRKKLKIWALSMDSYRYLLWTIHSKANGASHIKVVQLEDSKVQRCFTLNCSAWWNEIKRNVNWIKFTVGNIDD